jgi:hypothetical protein
MHAPNWIQMLRQVLGVAVRLFRGLSKNESGTVQPGA